jgi:hypothetical protein
MTQFPQTKTPLQLLGFPPLDKPLAQACRGAMAVRPGATPPVQRRSRPLSAERIRRQRNLRFSRRQPGTRYKVWGTVCGKRRRPNLLRKYLSTPRLLPRGRTSLDLRRASGRRTWPPRPVRQARDSLLRADRRRMSRGLNPFSGRSADTCRVRRGVQAAGGVPSLPFLARPKDGFREHPRVPRTRGSRFGSLGVRPVTFRRGSSLNCRRALERLKRRIARRRALSLLRPLLRGSWLAHWS